MKNSSAAKMPEWSNCDGFEPKKMAEVAGIESAIRCL